MPAIIFGQQAPPSSPYPSSLRGFLQAAQDTVIPSRRGTGFDGPLTPLRRLPPLVDVPPVERTRLREIDLLETLVQGQSSANASPVTRQQIEARISRGGFTFGNPASAQQDQEQRTQLPQQPTIPVQDADP